MTPKLTVQNAEIRTATVEVRTLTLSGKQVTLSVFRQIEKAGILNQDGTLRGEAWGRVNYCADGCKDTQKHAHVVWQDGPDLRRASVPASPRFQDFSSANGDAWLTSAILDYLNGDTTQFADDAKVPVDAHYGLGGQAYKDLAIDGLQFQVDAHSTVVPAWKVRPGSAWEWRPDARGHSEIVGRWQEAKARLDATVAAYGATTARLWELTQLDVAQEQKRRAAYRATCIKLNELSQLFIAV